MDKERKMEKVKKGCEEEDGSKKEVDLSSQLVCERSLNAVYGPSVPNFHSLVLVQSIKRFFWIEPRRNHIVKKKGACWDVILN